MCRAAARKARGGLPEAGSRDPEAMGSRDEADIELRLKPQSRKGGETARSLAVSLCVCVCVCVCKCVSLFRLQSLPKASCAVPLVRIAAGTC